MCIIPLQYIHIIARFFIHIIYYQIFTITYILHSIKLPEKTKREQNDLFLHSFQLSMWSEPSHRQLQLKILHHPHAMLSSFIPNLMSSCNPSQVIYMCYILNHVPSETNVVIIMLVLCSSIQHQYIQKTKGLSN